MNGLILLAALLLQQTEEVDRWGLVVTNGTDTVSIERVVRTAAELRSEILVPDRARLSVTATLHNSHCVSGAVVEVFPWGSSSDATPLQRISVQLDGDSVRVEVRARDVSRSMSRHFPGVDFVLAGDSYAASGQIVDCALAQGDSVSIEAVAFPRLRVTDLQVYRRGDTVLVVGEQTARVTLGIDGRPDRMEVGDSGLVVQRVPFEQVRSFETPAPDYSAPPDAVYRAEEVAIPVTPSVTLAGTLTLPNRSDGAAPAVVLVSGSGAQDRDCSAPIGGGWRPFRELADALSSRGIAVLRFDDRGVGASGGDHAVATERQTVEDVRAAVALLRARSEVDGGRVAVLGHSEGARIAMLVGAQDEELAGLVLMAGAADPRAAARAQAIWVVEHRPGEERPSRDSVIAMVDRMMDSAAVTGSREVFRWDAATHARRFSSPVAVFHGATDRQVPAEQADSLGALFRNSGNTDVTVRVFPGVNHLFIADTSGDFLRYDQLQSGRLDPAVPRAVVDWVVAHLSSSPDGDG